MKVVALNGSPKLAGNTSAAVNIMLDELEKQGVRTEHIQMYGSMMTPCNDCGSCVIRGDGRCINENDDMNRYLETLVKADGIVMAAPTYYGGIPGQMKILFERIGLVSMSDKGGNKLARKVGAAIAVQGRDGGVNTYSQMIRFMMRNKMVICSSQPLTVLTGEKPGDIMNDRSGVEALKELGKEMAWIIAKMKD